MPSVSLLHSLYSILILTPFLIFHLHPYTIPYIPSVSLHHSLYSILILTPFLIFQPHPYPYTIPYIPSVSLLHSLYSILILTPFLLFHLYLYSNPYIPSLSLHHSLYSICIRTPFLVHISSLILIPTQFLIFYPNPHPCKHYSYYVFLIRSHPLFKMFHINPIFGGKLKPSKCFGGRFLEEKEKKHKQYKGIEILPKPLISLIIYLFNLMAIRPLILYFIRLDSIIDYYRE